jgi:hypothetical protein
MRQDRKDEENDMTRSIDHRTLTLKAGTSVTAEERAALNLPEEAPEVPTLHARGMRVTSWQRYGDGTTGYTAHGGGVIDLPDGTIRLVSAYNRTRGRGPDSEAEAVAAWEQAIWRDAVAHDEWVDREARWGRTIEAMAAGNRRGRLGEGWTLADHHRPVIGEIVRHWAHGGYRAGVVVDVTKGRGVVIGYATPSNPNDHHYTKTTKYAVSTGIRPMALGS